MAARCAASSVGLCSALDVLQNVVTASGARPSRATSTLSPRSVLVQPSDGKIVVTGAVPDSSKQGASDFAVARYNGTTTP